MDGFAGQPINQTTTLKRDRSEDEDYGVPAKRAVDEVTLANPFMDSNENVSEKYPIPESAVGIVIGRGGSEIQGIQAKAGCRVQMSSDPDQTGFRQVNLEGTRGAVETAKALIDEVVARSNGPRGGGGGGGQFGTPRSQITVDIPIPPNRCGLIIGKQGDTIRQLQEKSGCKMVLVQDSQIVGDTSKPLRITGDPSKVEAAKRLVADILNGGNDGNGGGGMGQMHHGNAGGGASARGEVVVPRSSVGIIIGKQGDTIKRLAMETGTKIQFKPDDDPSLPERCAVITGTRDQIYRATEKITELVKKSAMQNGGGGGGGGGMMSHDTSSFYMSVPASKCGLVIGKGGETIKQINSESGAHCELSRDATGNPDEKVFVIKGGKREMEHAKHLIRIKVGDIAPNTPFRDDSLVSAQPQYAAQAQYGAQQWGAQAAVPVMANAAGAQNPYQQVGGWQQNAAYAQQPAAAAAPYAQGMVQAQPQLAAAYQQQQVAQGAQAATSAPAVDPVTGEQDYSAQWMEYYKSIGALDKAEAVEAQMKKKKAEAAARASGSATGLLQQMPMGMPMQQITGQPAAIPGQPYQPYQAQTTVAYQPQQYGQYQ